MVSAQKPDILIIRKKENMCSFIGKAIQWDGRVGGDKEKEKLDKYQDLASYSSSKSLANEG